MILLVYMVLAAVGASLMLGLNLVIAGTPLREKQVLLDFAVASCAIIGFGIVAGGLVAYGLRAGAAY